MSAVGLRASVSPSRLLEIEEELRSSFLDQRDLLCHVAGSLRRELNLFRDFSRPIGRFFLSAPDDAVALRLAAGLAQFLFGSEKAVLHLAMKEYSEKHKVSGLVGHTGGLVQDYVEGELTEPLWRQPQTVVVMSAIDRMHPDCWRILIPILTEGTIIDGLGRTVEFKDSVFIMTTTLECKTTIDQTIVEEGLRLIRPIIPVRCT